MGESSSGARSKLWVVVWFLICTTGCFYQVADVSHLYFQYTTSRIVKILVPKELKRPLLSVCVKYTEILDLVRYQSTQNVVLNFTRDDIEQMQQQFTIAELFKFTPPIQDVLQGCGIRRSYSMDLLSGDKCRERFKTSKTYLQEYICYQFHLIDRRPLIYKNAARALSYVNTIFFVNLNLKVFENVTLFKAIMHADEIPDIDADLSPPLTRVIDDKNNRTDNLYEFNYYYVNTKRMAAPYDTNCLEYNKVNNSLEDQFQCLDDCVIGSVLSEYNRVPFSNMVRLACDKKHITDKDVANATIAVGISNIENVCQAKCSQNDCENTYLSTYVAISTNEKFQIVANVPNAPCFEIVCVPDMTLTTFIIFVCGCFNIWYGLSAMSVDPAPMIRSLVNKRRKDKGGRPPTVQFEKMKQPMSPLVQNVHSGRDEKSIYGRFEVQRGYDEVVYLSPKHKLVQRSVLSPFRVDGYDRSGALNYNGMHFK